MISAIAHPTDFAPEGQMAFLHALRLALAYRCRLDLLHVRSNRDNDHFEKFPHVREVLQRWGVLAPGASADDIAPATGVSVRKVEIRDADAVDGLSRFLLSHRTDLIVMASHGRNGLNRWLSGSVSAEVARETHAPVLIFGPAASAFVDVETGALSLCTILVPVAREPFPGRALRHLSALTEGLDVGLDFMHVGSDGLRIHDAAGNRIAVRQIEGSVVEAIISEAQARNAQLIAMPTAGHQGFLDALRGSTIEQVVAQARCPVLALPAQTSDS